MIWKYEICLNLFDFIVEILLFIEWWFLNDVCWDMILEKCIVIFCGVVNLYIEIYSSFLLKGNVYVYKFNVFKLIKWDFLKG